MFSGEKKPEQLIVEGYEIFSNQLQWRLEFRGRDEQKFIDLAQAFLNVHFELLVTVRMPLAIRIFLYEGVGGGADVVPVFFHEQADGAVVTGFLRAASLLEFSVAEFLDHFCFVHSTRFSVETRLQFAELVSRRRAAAAAQRSQQK